MSMHVICMGACPCLQFAVVVNVVAQEGHQVGIGQRDVAVRAVAAELPVLARCDRQLQGARHLVARRRGARAADRADGVAQHEAVPVPSARRQAGRIDVHAVRQFRHGGGRTLRDDAAKGFVARDFPAHAQRHRRDRRAQRVAQDARPQDHRVRQRRARGHAEAERIGTLGGRCAAAQRGARDRGRQPGRIQQEGTARRHRCVSRCGSAIRSAAPGAACGPGRWRRRSAAPR